MQIFLYVPGLPFNGTTIPEGHDLGGSESAGYYLAKELAGFGHKVTVFSAILPEAEGTWDGVKYNSIGIVSQQYPLGDKFQNIVELLPHDLLIIQRHPLGFHPNYPSKVNVWWTHDLALHRSLSPLMASLWNIDVIAGVSNWHLKQIEKVYQVKPELLRVIHNGIDLSLFPSEKIDAVKKQTNKFLTYSHRPERGLQLLVEPGGIMEKIVQKDSDIRLAVAGYNNTTQEMAAFYQYLWNRVEQLPNAKNFGHLSKQNLAEVLMQAWLHIYPTQFQETSCITAMETQAAGTPIVTAPVGALPETLQDGGVFWVKNHSAEDYVKVIFSILDHPEKWMDAHKKALKKSEEYRWSKSANDILRIYEEIIRGKTKSSTQMMKHFLHTSDIFAAKKYAEKTRKESFLDNIEQNVLKEIDECYGFATPEKIHDHYESYYAHEKARGVVYGPENLDGNLRFELVYKDLTKLPHGDWVLDFGCAHGHYTNNLARRFPYLNFVGVDWATSNITIAIEWAKQDKLENVSFICGESDSLKEFIGKFSYIYIGELLEHTLDPDKPILDLMPLLNDYGKMGISTPFGPWESEGYWLEYPWRAHISHFEIDDINDKFGHFPGLEIKPILITKSSQDEAIGNYHYTFPKTQLLPKPINYDRKFSSQGTRETISACIICKSDSFKIAECLKSIRPIVDEIIIGFDGERGRAWAIAEEFGALSFAIPSPLSIGFDAARNLTLEKAVGDWILWIDEDETLKFAGKLGKFLRKNNFDAYAIAQHHLSAEPLGVIQTDHPNRVFRNNRGVKFFGRVHEHPETKINEGIGRMFAIPANHICIIHDGYDTEETRRKRFKRNWPLMVRDREDYPERYLGKFLWIRDLAHRNRMEYEQTGQTSKAMLERCQEGWKIWRDLVKDDLLRYAVDSLPYLAELAVLLGGNNVFHHEFQSKLNFSGYGDNMEVEDTKIKGIFLSLDDIKLLDETISKDKYKSFVPREFF